jgi:hypothetical protein
MKDNYKAFPSLMVFENVDGVQRLESGGPGMSLKQYAAIQLKVPRSGDQEIDDWIRESRRSDFMGQAMLAITSKVYKTKDYNGPFIFEDIADEARIMADAMLAEWEKEK